MKKNIGYLLYIVAGIIILFLILVTILIIPGMTAAFKLSAAKGAGYTSGLLLIWLIIGSVITYLIRTARKAIRFNTENNPIAKEAEV